MHNVRLGAAAFTVAAAVRHRGRPFGTVITGSAVGEELIRILVGGIALVLAVPVTTAVAAVGAAAGGARTSTHASVTDRVDPQDDHTLVRRAAAGASGTRTDGPSLPPPPRPRS